MRERRRSCGLAARRASTTVLIAGIALWLLAPVAAQADDPKWEKEAAARLPSGWVAGRVIRLDEAGLKATIAVFPAGADTPATPGSAFNPGKVLEVALKSENGALAVASTTLRARRPDEAANDEGAEYQAQVLQDLARKKAAEPAVEPCRIQGWSLDDSRRGLAVRASPADDAKIVGWLAPVRRTPESGQGSEDGWRVEFDITGYRDGWFRIANATPPGAPYDDPPPKGSSKTYSGVGWIRVSQAGGAYANTQMPVARLLQYPHVDAPGEPPEGSAAGPDGRLSIDGTLMRLHACSANWALTTSRDGHRGWWRGICSNQVTNCS